MIREDDDDSALYWMEEKAAQKKRDNNNLIIIFIGVWVSFYLPYLFCDVYDFLRVFAHKTMSIAFFRRSIAVIAGARLMLSKKDPLQNTTNFDLHCTLFTLASYLLCSIHSWNFA